jgi:hypothetical protein
MEPSHSPAGVPILQHSQAGILMGLCLRKDGSVIPPASLLCLSGSWFLLHFVSVLPVSAVFLSLPVCDCVTVLSTETFLFPVSVSLPICLFSRSFLVSFLAVLGASHLNSGPHTC